MNMMMQSIYGDDINLDNNINYLKFIKFIKKFHKHNKINLQSTQTFAEMIKYCDGCTKLVKWFISFDLAHKINNKDDKIDEIIDRIFTVSVFHGKLKILKHLVKTCIKHFENFERSLDEYYLLRSVEKGHIKIIKYLYKLDKRENIKIKYLEDKNILKKILLCAKEHNKYDIEKFIKKL